MNKNCQAVYKKQRSGALHLTKKVDYGITLLAALAKDKSPDLQSLKVIADEKKMSFSFLQKVARTLLKAGIIKAHRGKYGGYSLKKDPKKLTVMEIIEALEGQIAIAPCLKTSRFCLCKRESQCEIKYGFQMINADIQKYFSKKTLSQIIP